MKYIQYSILLIILGLTNSCTNLDEEVYSSITEATYTYVRGDATKLVGAVYTNFRDYYGFNRYFGQEICTDELIQPANASGWSDGGVFARMHLHTWTSEQNHVREWWEFNYKGALLANRVINQLQSEGFPFADDENKESLVAEMRALRAFHYWQIMDLFGDAPLVTVDDNEVLPEKTTRSNMYDFVVKELIECIPTLPEDKTEKNYGRFVKWGAKALLANVYLNAGVYTETVRWEECLKECNDIIQSGKYMLDDDYRTPFLVNNEISAENIFVIPFNEVYANGFDYYHVSLHSANQKTFATKDGPWGAGCYKGVPQFIDTYDADDERIDATWLYGHQYERDGTTPLLGAYDLMGKHMDYINTMPDGIYTGEAEGYRWIKYEIAPECLYGLNNDFVVFRYAQVLLMKAECLLRTGKADEAAQIVTDIRKRAFKGKPEKAVVTGAMLQEPSVYVYGTVKEYKLTPQGEGFPKEFGRFYDEMGWEMVGEMFRRRDMIRFGHYTKVQWLSHVPNGDYRVVFPIPQKAVDSNPDLKQNPDYVN